MIRRHSNQHYADVVARQMDGQTQRQIAAHYGVSETTVARWMREARARGIAPRSQGKGFSVRAKTCACCGASSSHWRRTPSA